MSQRLCCLGGTVLMARLCRIWALPVPVFDLSTYFLLSQWLEIFISIHWQLTLIWSDQCIIVKSAIINGKNLQILDKLLYGIWFLVSSLQYCFFNYCFLCSMSNNCLLTFYLTNFINFYLTFYNPDTVSAYLILNYVMTLRQCSCLMS